MHHYQPQLFPVNAIVCLLQVYKREPQLAFGLQTMLDNSLEYQDLFDGTMVGSETSLCGCVEVMGISSSRKSLVHGGHK